MISIKKNVHPQLKKMQPDYNHLAHSRPQLRFFASIKILLIDKITLRKAIQLLDAKALKERGGKFSKKIPTISVNRALRPSLDLAFYFFP